MTRSGASAVAAAAVALAVGASVAAGIALRGRNDAVPCAAGFVRTGTDCLVGDEGPSLACPAPLVSTARGCDAPDVHVLVPPAAVAIGPSDWEAEGRVAARVIHTKAFAIDAFEVTVGAWEAWAADSHRSASSLVGARFAGDSARAAAGMTREEAAAFCASRGGRLPTEDEWIAAAVSAANPPRRYPWGDTGAVCRRAAWGMASGPCGAGGNGPDTAGAHPDGDSPLGVHDLSGNVAEWVAESVATSAGREGGASEATAPAIAKGGSWQSALASELRVWARLELPRGARDRRVGFRCAYPPEKR